MEFKTVSTIFADRELTLETGKLATLTSGSILAKFGDIHILVTVGVSDKAREGVDFLPLSVDFQEKFYASGKIKGSRFIKREGRPSDDCILTSRLIDRPIRPMFPKTMRNEVQVVATVLSTDQSMNAGPIALIATSAAILLTGVPFEAPVSAVRVGMKNGEFVLMPTYEQTDNGDLDLVVAGTVDAITMVEAASKEISDEKMLEALEFAHKHIKDLCKLQEDLIAQCHVQPITIDEQVLDVALVEKVGAMISQEMMNDLYNKSKKEFLKNLETLNEHIIQNFTEAIEKKEVLENDIKEAVYKKLKIYMREKILKEEVRLDGRGVKDVRPIKVEVGLLPKTHGSALFNRGETQILSVLTLGGPQDALVEDSMDNDVERHFWHHYTFLPFATGEVRPYRGVGRREIGHGKLGEKALKAVLPEKDKFPYTIALMSETLACNGSSSMGSICGSTLALMDAGVPIKKPVTAIAMGLIINEEIGEYKILTDIQAQEDFLGDMDFKVAGTDQGLTALQMDIKVKGLKLSLLKEALQQAKEGRDYIWTEMSKVISEPRKELNKNAPLIASMQLESDDIRVVIGKGGEMIQKISKECNVEMQIDDNGLLSITAPDRESGNKAANWVKQLVYKPKAGDVFDGKVTRLMDFGAFVEFLPGKEGLVHVSELGKGFVKSAADVVKVGDAIKVKLIKIDDQGRYNLSAKV
ncbi:MAG: polyribonucleotide nucleotidyltransferase, polyribonucleotide nucleotidyltransferase [Candidatus Peregrinibacteria bacterium GW2011_GWF2_33_10]|nr:MAG: polyribonucleotide nucleotidyltransferase, polyribonucleotide nucleotidyltransferase [Candidatus Peregrinibacteria bacterium GW2011_GWF2_33_10]OGJ44087.1 MAG: polyribonucleotide nucleotidyltransferase [Candidatus Peregrinibacteria bacterium RIFOXYA2_FULL_33_21]OGJ45733.1 MAG: polyribonucleotide nucleotidyltransferase [Candidatus Peregrinibacteria bacterium RIFOXYA12_FULL_33_12]OGJ51388.1 MAG: polyribonucleotide nucleotidyltransferase [Candidatus Peregrinibacteria bacterium RIFOXYB2_FULL_